MARIQGNTQADNQSMKKMLGMIVTIAITTIIAAGVYTYHLSKQGTSLPSAQQTSKPIPVESPE